MTARDFQVADAIWGTGVASLKGMTTKTTHRAADRTIGRQLVQCDQVLSVDIMFIDRAAILNGVAHPLDLTFGISLVTADMLRPSRAAGVVKEAIFSIVSKLASRNFKTSMIMSDGEGAIGKLRRELNHIRSRYQCTRSTRPCG